MLSPSADADRGVIECRGHSVGAVPSAVTNDGHLNLERRTLVEATDVVLHVDVAALRRRPYRVEQHTEGALAVHRHAGRTARLIPRRTGSHTERGEGEHGDGDDECRSH